MTKVREMLLRQTVEHFVGPLDMWDVSVDSIKFRADRNITLSDVSALADELQTDAINFYFGSDSNSGYIQVMLHGL
jgi:hypothetical protein